MRSICTGMLSSWLLTLVPTDEASQKPRRFLVDVEETMKLVLEQEDTDGNFQVSSGLRRMLKNTADVLPTPQIAATDKGPKVFSLGTASSNGYNSFDVS